MTGSYTIKEIQVLPMAKWYSGGNRYTQMVIFVIRGGAYCLETSNYGWRGFFKVPSDFAWLEDIFVVTSTDVEGDFVLKHNASRLLRAGEINPLATFSTDYMTYHSYANRLNYLNVTPTDFAADIKANDLLEITLLRDFDNETIQNNGGPVCFIMKYVANV